MALGRQWKKHDLNLGLWFMDQLFNCCAAFTGMLRFERRVLGSIILASHWYHKHVGRCLCFGRITFHFLLWKAASSRWVPAPLRNRSSEHSLIMTSVVICFLQFLTVIPEVWNKAFEITSSHNTVWIYAEFVLVICSKTNKQKPILGLRCRPVDLGS